MNYLYDAYDYLAGNQNQQDLNKQQQQIQQQQLQQIQQQPPKRLLLRQQQPQPQQKQIYKQQLEERIEKVQKEQKKQKLAKKKKQKKQRQQQRQQWVNQQKQRYSDIGTNLYNFGSGVLGTVYDAGGDMVLGLSQIGGGGGKIAKGYNQIGKSLQNSVAGGTFNPAKWWKGGKQAWKGGKNLFLGMNQVASGIVKSSLGAGSLGVASGIGLGAAALARRAWKSKKVTGLKNALKQKRLRQHLTDSAFQEGQRVVRKYQRAKQNIQNSQIMQRLKHEATPMIKQALKKMAKQKSFQLLQPFSKSISQKTGLPISQVLGLFNTEYQPNKYKIQDQIDQQQQDQVLKKNIASIRQQRKIQNERKKLETEKMLDQIRLKSIQGKKNGKKAGIIIDVKQPIDQIQQMKYLNNKLK